MCHPDDIAAVVTTVATTHSESLASLPTPSPNQTDPNMATEVINRSYEHKMATKKRIPPKDTRTITTSTPTTGTHITLVTATATSHVHTNGGKAQLFRAFAVLLRRSMLIGPLWCKVAPLMAKIAEYLSKIKCGTVPTFSRAKNFVGRVLRDHVSELLERLTTPKGECRG